jgi:hypothetical protein
MSEISETALVQPILVVLVWRGGARFQRALDSIREAEVADSMLNLAVMADSLMQDSLKKDSIK